MTEMTIQIPAELAKQLRPYQNRLPELLQHGIRVLEAQSRSRAVDETVYIPYRQRNRVWPTVPALPQDDPLIAETEAFLAMHSELVKNYLSEHVAIYQGVVVDHDADMVALMLRTREKYGSGRVLLRQVETEPDRVLRVTSFHLTHE